MVVRSGRTKTEDGTTPYVSPLNPLARTPEAHLHQYTTLVHQHCRSGGFVRRTGKVFVINFVIEKAGDFDILQR